MIKDLSPQEEQVNSLPGTKLFSYQLMCFLVLPRIFHRHQHRHLHYHRHRHLPHHRHYHRQRHHHRHRHRYHCLHQMEGHQHCFRWLAVEGSIARQ